MRSDAGETLGERFAVGWSGMRGAVSLAAALAVSLDVPGRPQIIFLTFALILVTLVGQGLSLPFVIRKLRLEEPRRWSDEEAVARMEAAQSALDRIDEMENEERADESQLKRLRDLYRARFRMCQAVLGGEDPETAAREQRIADYGELRRELIGIERENLLDLRGGERLRNATMRQIERDLDLEEARIRSYAAPENSRARAATRSGRSSAMKWPQPGDQLDLASPRRGAGSRPASPGAGRSRRCRRRAGSAPCRRCRGVAAAHDRPAPRAVEDPVHLHRRPRPRRLGEVSAKIAQRLRVPDLFDRGAADQDPRDEVAAAVQPVADPGREDQPAGTRSARRGRSSPAG